jgi:hypothetical protein
MEKASPVALLGRKASMPVSKRIVEDTGDQVWVEEGKHYPVIHRVSGPARKSSSGYNSWWQHGCLHNLKGPAIESSVKTFKDYEGYYLYGLVISKENFYNKAYRRLSMLKQMERTE